MLTSSLNYETTQFLQNTSTPRWTQSGPSIQMVYSDIPDTYMSQIPTTSNFVFFSTCMIIPLQDTMVSPRPLYQVCLHYYCPTLPVYIKNYCKSCTICSHAKPVHHRPYGLLKQLPISKKPWNSISMDFIEKLPESSGYMSILVIVDHLSKQSLFILTYNTITSQQ